MSTAGVAEPAGAALPALRLRIRRKAFPALAGAPAKLALADFALDVPRRTVTALFGPSGCGKTTCLNLIAGIDRAFEGSIERGDAGRIGYVFQEPRLLPWRSVEDNLRLVLEHPDAADAEAAIGRWLERMELRDVRKVFPNRLSLGMARRVALARAFIIEPGLLLLDEPFVSLDEPTAMRLRLLLLEVLRGHPTSAVFVTHNLREAIMLADRIAVMSPAPGRVLREVVVPLSAAERRDEAALEGYRTTLLGELAPTSPA